MKRKTVVICLIAMFALAAMGFGFAKWSDTVTASVYIDTGKVQVGILDVGTNDDPGDLDDVDNLPVVNSDWPDPDPQIAPGHNSEGKDVASKKSENVDAKFTIGNKQYYQKVVETITNAYPYYGPTTVGEIANGGTIPVKIESMTCNVTGNAAADYHLGAWTVTYPSGSVNGTGEAALYAELKGKQLHPNEVIKVEAQECFGQATPQGSSATITCTLTASQWNEVP